MKQLKQIFKKGFKAVAEETERREKAIERKKGKLFRFFLKKGDKDVPIRFLTEEPINYWEHTLKEGGNFVNYPCIGDGCPYCDNGDKPRYVSAWLIVDLRSVTYKDKDGNEKTYKDRIKLLVRGIKDASLLENMSRKYGLVGTNYSVTRTGEGTSTSWNFDHEDKFEYSAKQIDALRAQLPEPLREEDFEDIILMQIMPDEDEDADEKEPEGTVDAPDVEKGVSDIEEPEEEHKRKPLLRKKK